MPWICIEYFLWERIGSFFYEGYNALQILVDIFKIMSRSDLNKFVAYSTCVCVCIAYCIYKATFLVMTHI